MSSSCPYRLLSAAGEHPAVDRRQDAYRRRCWPIRRCSPELGLNRREIEYLGSHPFPELASLYYAPYLDSFRDEYRPFDAGLNHLDQLSTTDLFRKDGASAGALEFIGGSGSALQSVWHAAILKVRGVPLFPPRVFRLVGGNQKLPDALVDRLGARMPPPLAGDPHRTRGNRCTGHVPRQTSGSVTHEADHLVCAMSAVMLRAIPVAPAWPADKHVGAAERAVLFRLAGDLPVALAVLETRSHQPEHGIRRPGTEPRLDRPARRWRRRAG